MTDSLLDWDRFLPLAYLLYSLFWIFLCAGGITWGMKKLGRADFTWKNGLQRAFILLLAALAVKLAVLIKIGFPFYKGRLDLAVHPYYNLIHHQVSFWLTASLAYFLLAYLYLKWSLKLDWKKALLPWLAGVMGATLFCLLVALPFFPWYINGHPLPFVK